MLFILLFFSSLVLLFCYLYYFCLGLHCLHCYSFILVSVFVTNIIRVVFFLSGIWLLQLLSSLLLSWVAPSLLLLLWCSHGCFCCCFRRRCCFCHWYCVCCCGWCCRLECWFCFPVFGIFRRPWLLWEAIVHPLNLFTLAI